MNDKNNEKKEKLLFIFYINIIACIITLPLLLMLMRVLREKISAENNWLILLILIPHMFWFRYINKIRYMLYTERNSQKGINKS